MAHVTYTTTVLLCLLYSTLLPSHMNHKSTNISYTPYFTSLHFSTQRIRKPCYEHQPAEYSIAVHYFLKTLSYFALHYRDKNAVHPCYTNSATSPTRLCGGEVYVTFEGANASERPVQRRCGTTLHNIFLFTFNLTAT